MKKKIITSSLILGLLFNPCTFLNTAKAENNIEKMRVISDLNMRTAPNLKSHIEKVLSKDTVVNCIEKGTKWNKIIFNEKQYYLYNKYLKEEPEILYTPEEFRHMGVVYWDGWRWTWYSQRVLPGGGLKIPGRHVNENGYVVDENERICLASSTLSKGTIINTPFGAEGCVYDSGCAVGTVDVYTDF